MSLPRSFLLPALSALLVLTSLSLPAQQSPSGVISAQQVMQILAGMREDLNQANSRDKQLSLRLDTLEEGVNQFTTEIARLRSLCTELAQQNQALESRMTELQKAMEADQKARREEWQSLTKDLSAMVRSAAPPPVPAPNVPTKELTILAGDTLSSIAKAAKCTVAELMALNPHLKNADELRVGQVLRVPVK